MRSFLLAAILAPLTYAGAITFTTSYTCSPNNNCNQNGLTATFSSTHDYSFSIGQNTFDVSAQANVGGDVTATGSLSINGTAILDAFLTTDGPVRSGIMTYSISCAGDASFFGGGSGSITLNGNLLGGGLACPSTQTIPFTLGQTFELQLSAFANGFCPSSPCIVNGGSGAASISFSVEAPFTYYNLDGNPVLTELHLFPVSPAADPSIPEPSAASLLAIGAATLFLLRAKAGQRRDYKGGNR